MKKETYLNHTMTTTKAATTTKAMKMNIIYSNSN